MNWNIEKSQKAVKMYFESKMTARAFYQELK